MVKECLLQQMLAAAYMAEYCRTVDRAGIENFALGAIMGELDWVSELARLKELVFMSTGSDQFGTPYDRTTFPVANTRQVGGAHYRVAYQHWDYAADAELGYFEGQVTKYVTRWRKKNVLQDLEKALHYLEKLQELYREQRVTRTMPRRPAAAFAAWAVLVNQTELELGGTEKRILYQLVAYAQPKELEEVKSLLKTLIKENQ